MIHCIIQYAKYLLLHTRGKQYLLSHLAVMNFDLMCCIYTDFYRVTITLGNSFRCCIKYICHCVLHISGTVYSLNIIYFFLVRG